MYNAIPTAADAPFQSQRCPPHPRKYSSMAMIEQGIILQMEIFLGTFTIYIPPTPKWMNNIGNEYSQNGIIGLMKLTEKMIFRFYWEHASCVSPSLSAWLHVPSD